MKKSRLLGGVLLVSGTSIGAGMLALPVVTSFSGFYPSLLLLLLVWMFMTFTAFLFLEVVLWMKEETNLISMAKFTLGNAGAVLSWIVYLFLLYALTIAYLAGSGALLGEAIESWTGAQIQPWMAYLPFIIIFGSFIYLGVRSVDLLNRCLMLGLLLSYLLLVVIVPEHINTQYFEHCNWSGMFIALSVLVTSFGFHIIIPSLVHYMGDDVKASRTAIFIGSLIPLCVYLLWEYLVLGVVPVKGDNGLCSLWVTGGQVISPLKAIVGSPWVIVSARFFSFFAIATSFLGVSLSLSDFLADFLYVIFRIKTKSTRAGKLLLCSLTFLPPLIFAVLFPGIFFQALEYAGAFGVVILLGVLPAAMAWSGRYFMGIESEYRVKGGKPSLIVVFAGSIFVTIVVIIEINGWLDWITQPFL